MKKFPAWWLPVVIVTMLIFMILHPQETLDAAFQGFMLWSKVVLPALFPFLVTAGLLFPSGLVDYLEVLLKPVMQPLFRLPGSAALPVFMGFTSGFPVGAILTRRLYDEKRISLSQAEHLVAFTNNSSPLFVLGSVGVGLFGNPAAGLLLLLSHYGGNLLLGLLLRFTHRKSQTAPEKEALLSKAAQAFHEHRLQHPQGLGQLMSEAIRSAFVSITTIAGFIVIFSVFTRMLSCWGVLELISRLLLPVVRFCGLSVQILPGLSHGLFEMTLGCQLVSQAPTDVTSQLMTVTLLMAFSGISIIAQIMSIMGNIPIRWSRFLLCRGVQTGFSLMLLQALTPFFLEIPVFSGQTLAEQSARLLYSFDYWTLSLLFLLLSLLALLILLLCMAWRYRA